MPPHCDSLDGPVVAAARRALEAGNADLVLPFVYEKGWDEVRQAFDLARRARAIGGAATELADLWFFETVVRIHRTGEGAPYTGLKPAGLDVGPVIPVAEQAIASGEPGGLVRLLTARLEDEIRTRFTHLRHLEAEAGRGLPETRRHVEATLGLQVWAHGLYQAIAAPAHAGHDEHD